MDSIHSLQNPTRYISRQLLSNGVNMVFGQRFRRGWQHAGSEEILPLNAKAFFLLAEDAGCPVSSSSIAITVSVYGPCKSRIRPARIQVTTGTCGCSRQRDGDKRPPSKPPENHQHSSSHGKGHLRQPKHEAHPAPDQAMRTRGRNARKRARRLLPKPSPTLRVYRSHVF